MDEMERLLFVDKLLDVLRKVEEHAPTDDASKWGEMLRKRLTEELKMLIN